MPEEENFAFVAADSRGRQVRGRLEAKTASLAHAELQRRGLSPIRLTAAAHAGSRGRAHLPLWGGRALSPGDRALAEFLSDLSALLGAGADIRAALDMLGERSEGGATRILGAGLARDLSSGSSLGAALASRLPPKLTFVSSLAEAGASGIGLAEGLRRAAEMLEARIKLRDQMVTTLSYPVFVLATTVLAIAAILFFVVPSLAPLIEDAGNTPPFFLVAAVTLSNVLRANLPIIGMAAVVTIAGLWIGLRSTTGRAALQRGMIDGPARQTASGLAFGSFAVTLGNLLTGGASMDAALTLATEAVGTGLVRERLRDAGVRVRQGQRLSDALASVRSFPTSIVRLAMVGEATGALGEMLSRGGRLEEAKALRRLEAAARLIGPVTIVLLGSVIGLLMAGLLSGVSQLGQAAIR